MEEGEWGGGKEGEGKEGGGTPYSQQLHNADRNQRSSRQGTDRCGKHVLHYLSCSQTATLRRNVSDGRS